MNNQPDLADLIEAARKGGEISYERISQACGGAPSAKRLHQMQNQSIKSFPDPDTIRALSRGTGFSVSEIVAASARSLGLHVAAQDGDLLRVHGLSQLPVNLVSIIQDLAREVVSLAEAKAASDSAYDSLQESHRAEYDLAADDHSGDPIGFDDDPHET